jgi:hypothetical protein
MMERPLTTQQAAAELGYHVVYLRQLLREGKVKGQRFNQAWMIEPSEVERVKALQGPGGRLPKAPKQLDS